MGAKPPGPRIAFKTSTTQVAWPAYSTAYGKNHSRVVPFILTLYHRASKNWIPIFDTALKLSLTNYLFIAYAIVHVNLPVNS